MLASKEDADVFDVMRAHKMRYLSLTPDFDKNNPKWQANDLKVLLPIVRRITEKNFEQLFFSHDPQTFSRTIIAIHSTLKGPALGGWRISPYNSFEEQLVDAIGNPGIEGLAEGMTKKALMAGLPLGGGKAVTDADPSDSKIKNEKLIMPFAQALLTINEDKLKYITAEDSGVGEQDIEMIARITDGKYVVGRPRTIHKGGFKGSGDPGIFTAFGIIRGMKAACNFLGIGDWFYDKTIAIEGLGGVGKSLADELIKRYPEMRIIAADKKCDRSSKHADKKTLKAFCESRNITLIESNEIRFQKCDIFSPCALRVSFNKYNISSLKCLIICGAQNNQLETEEDGYRLFNRGIVYIPDFIVNAGGLISVFDELNEGGYNYNRVVYGKIWKIYDRVLEILRKSGEEQLPPHLLANRMVAEKLAAL